MKKRIEHEELLTDVLGQDEQCRATTLGDGLAAVRRVRARRRVGRLTASVAAPLAVIAVMLILQSHRPTPRLTSQMGAPSAPAVKTIEGTSIRILSDEELLDFFKGRPVALVGSPGHQRLLLFDEEKN